MLCQYLTVSEIIYYKVNC